MLIRALWYGTLRRFMTDRKDIFLARKNVLQEGLQKDYVVIQVNPLMEGLDVPAHLLQSPNITLKLSYLYRGGLDLQDDKVVADLLFGSSYYCCSIPYEAIWAISPEAKDHSVWDESAPPLLAESFRKQHSSEFAEPAAPPKPAEVKARPQLRRVK
jgi:stringent starvation protein B